MNATSRFAIEEMSVAAIEKLTNSVIAGDIEATIEEKEALIAAISTRLSHLIARQRKDDPNAALTGRKKTALKGCVFCLMRHIEQLSKRLAREAHAAHLRELTENPDYVSPSMKRERERTERHALAMAQGTDKDRNGFRWALMMVVTQPDSDEARQIAAACRMGNPGAVIALFDQLGCPRFEKVSP